MANVEHARFVVAVVIVIAVVVSDSTTAVIAVVQLLLPLVNFARKTPKLFGLLLFLLLYIVKGKRTCCYARYEDVAAVTVAVAAVGTVTDKLAGRGCFDRLGQTW